MDEKLESLRNLRTLSNGRSGVMCRTDHAMMSKTRRSLARRVCIHCFSSVPLSAPSLRICAGCHGPRYCSLDCAKAHWRGGHRDVCSRAHAPAVAAPEPSRLTAISTASSDVSDRQGRLRSADLGIREDRARGDGRRDGHGRVWANLGTRLCLYNACGGTLIRP